MKPKQKKNKLPPNACAFYIRLYCDKKGSTETKYGTNMVEATKSWLSLTEPERQQFYTRYEECKDKYVFNQLKNAEPFMKIKAHSSRSNTNSANNLESKELDKDFEGHFPDNDIEQSKELEEIVEQTEDIQVTAEQSEQIAETTEHIDEALDPQISEESNQDAQSENKAETVDGNNTPNQTITLIEPLAPTIKTGSELFQMLNSTNDITWESLQQIEKYQYSRAVYIMKKDYITKYKAYLESLSSKELFDYYNKTIF